MRKSIFKFFSMRFISVLTIVCLLACSVDMTAFAQVVEETDATVTSDDVETIPATGIELNYSKIYLTEKQDMSLRASLVPENSTDSITWYSSDTNVATVSGNLAATIFMKGEGQTIITAKTTSGVSATCEVVVSQGDAVTEDFTYEITDGEVTITGYTGTETDVVIPETIDGYEVVYIGEYAFNGCNNLTSVSIPEGVMGIGKYAFYDCGNLVNIVIPKGVTEIGKWAFAQCRNLQSINIPEGVTEIKECTFYCCINLQRVEIPKGVTKIGELAFECCGLDSIKLPEGLTEIGAAAFSNCEGLCGMIKIPEGVTKIDESAFLYCPEFMITLELPKSLTTMEQVVDDPEDLLIVGYKGTRAEDFAKEYGTFFVNIESNTIPATELSLSETDVSIVYGETMNLQTTILPADTTDVIVWCSSDADVVAVSENGMISAVGEGTAIISARTGSGLLQLCNVNVVGGAETIVDEKGINYEINDGVATVSGYAGTDAEVVIPSSIEGYSVVGIDESAFFYSNNLESVEIPDSVTHIGDCAFEQCENLTNVKLPNTPFTMGWGVFGYCSKLSEIELTEGMTELGDWSFIECSSLQDIVLPDSLQNIGAGTFSGCTGLTSVEIPEGVTEIKNDAFNECSNLEEVVLPKTLTAIRESAFYNCDSLTNIEIPDNVNVIEGAFGGCDNLTSIKLPDGVLELGAAIFDGCTSLEEVTVSQQLADIGAAAFRNCTSLTSIELPASVTSIGNRAFLGCSSLTDIYFAGTEECWNKIAMGTNVGLDNVTIHFATSDDVVSPGDAEAIDFTYEINNGEVTIIGYTGSDTVIDIPETVSGCDVTAIGVSAFEGCRNVTGIDIPESVREIGANAFKECYSLVDINIPEGVTEIAAGTFSDCIYLVEIEIPKGVVKIGGGAFQSCNRLKSIVIPEGVTEIGAAAFRGSVHLTDITIPKSVETIGVYAFTGCSQLTIHGYGGSYAETYAKESGIAFHDLSLIPATAVALNSTSLTLKVNETYTLQATMTPVNTTDTVTWTSSATNVATVSDAGVITAVAKGTTVITVTTSGGKVASCTVTVEELEQEPVIIPATTIKLNKSKAVTINKGKTLTLKATLTPSNSTDSITWTSSKKNVANVVGDGKKAVVTGLKKGTTTITARTSSGKAVTCKVTVKEVKATKIKLNKTQITINKGKSYTLKATLTPKNTTDTVAWTSSKKSVAKVTGDGNKAVVTGVKKGTATITAKTSSGKKVTCKVTVKEIKSIRIKLNKTKLTLKVGKSATLKATLTPKNSTDTIKWSSSKSKIAKVSENGKVTAVKKGTATITAKTSSGKKVTCKVTVK